jgi:protein-S-isoprenylcysteine O-methyltransferase Ste14
VEKSIDAYNQGVRHIPAVLEVCLVGTSIVWLGLELRQALRIRHEARSVDRGSSVVVRLAAVASFVAAIGIAHAVPQATAGRNLMAGIGLGILWCGLALRAWCFHTLGRYFTLTVQTSDDQPVITAGPYRVLRHPSYTGLLLAFIGVGLAVTGNWLSALVLAPVVGLGLGYRIRVEERALLSDLGADYRAYAATHKRLVPFVW